MEFGLIKNIRLSLYEKSYNILPRPFEVYRSTGLELEFRDKANIIYTNPYNELFYYLQGAIKWKQS